MAKAGIRGSQEKPLKVREWIAWLQQQPLDNDVLLRDPDTEWYLTLLTKPTYPSDDAPEESTVVFAEYY